MQAGGCVLLAGVSPPFILLFTVVNPDPRTFFPIIFLERVERKGREKKT